MLESLAAGYESSRAALQIVKGVYALKTEAERNQAVIDIQRHVLETQRALMDAEVAERKSALRIDDLEREIARLQQWEGEKQHYQMARIDGRAFAYMAKEGHRGDAPAHWLCAPCFDRGEKSVLQHQGRGKEAREALHSCPRCKTTISTHWRSQPSYERPVEEGQGEEA